MTTDPAGRPGLTSRLLDSARLVGSVRQTAPDHRVTQFELFFDLVFVFAFTQVTQLMAHEHDALGIVRGVTILGILWWAWCSYSWLANHARADRGVLYGGMVVAMALIFVMAFAIPDAYADPGGPPVASFAIVVCFFLVRLVHVALYLVAAGDDGALRRQILVTMALALLPAIVAMAIGAAIGGVAQTWIWLGAWLYDALIVFVTSRQGGDWRLHSPSHWADRYALVVILAIGESIVSIGVGLSGAEPGVAAFTGAFLAVAGAVLLWWMYFHRFAAGVEHALAKASPKRRVAEASASFTYLHFPVVAGVILTALGVESVMAHVADAEPLGWFGAAALAGGVSLALAATVFIWVRMTGRWLVARLAFATLLLPGVVVVAALPPMVALGSVVAGGILLAVFESRVRVLHPRETAEGTVTG
jgi:low temperature requirement protein LtrA